MTEDESIFTYEIKIKKVWVKKGSKPRILVTGSKQRTCLFGAIANNQKQLFRQYPKCNQDYFLAFVKELQKKFKKMILFLDRATWHKRAKKVKRYFRKHRQTIKVKWFPKGWPELNPTEECWHQGKNADNLGLKPHPTFKDFKHSITTYYRTKRFKLNVYNYLCQ